MARWCQKKLKWLAILPMVGFLTAWTTSSQTSVQAESAPPPELERLEYFKGVWSCSQPADSDDPSAKFTWKVEQGLNNFWYLGNAQQDLVPDNGQPINSQEFLGYDAAQQKLVRSVVVGNGNSHSLLADDWQEDKLTWQGAIVMNGRSSPLKEEIVKDSPDRFIATYFVPGEDGGWQPVVNESCDRLNNTP
ncbi:MAG: DUF1579 family protein [Cyanobacteria bacterium J06633_1]